MTKYSLNPASDADEQWLDKLRRDAYRDLFSTTWGGWDEARHQRHFAETWKAGHISIVEVGGVRVGMIQILESSESVEVAEIQILPNYQGRGIGTRILNDVLEGASVRDKPVSLYLGLKNVQAYELYKRLGFKETGRSDTHIYMEYRHI